MKQRDFFKYMLEKSLFLLGKPRLCGSHIILKIIVRKLSGIVILLAKLKKMKRERELKIYRNSH